MTGFLKAHLPIVIEYEVEKGAEAKLGVVLLSIKNFEIFNHLLGGEKIGDGFGISVTSNGLPISENDKDRIFDRGIRGTNAQQKVPAGTGIGLYLASRVMRLHEGTIKLDTNLKRSRFTLVFPKERVV